MEWHIKDPNHIQLYQKKNEGHRNLQQRSLTHGDSTIRGMSLSREEKEYRCGSLIAAANGNAPLKCIKYFADWSNQYAKMTVCNEKDLIRSYISMVMTTLVEDIRKVVNQGSFKEFSLTFDGTPAFAEAEAVIIRVVTRDYNIVELPVKCNLFKNKLNSKLLASHILKTIRLKKDINDWVATQQDRASTNKGALKEIFLKFPNVKLSKNYCCSHTLSNGGKNL